MALIWPRLYCLIKPRSGPDLAQTILPEQAQSWPRAGLDLAQDHTPELAQVWPRSYNMTWARPGPVQAVWSWARSGPALGQTCACSGRMVWARSGPDLILFATSGPGLASYGPDLATSSPGIAGICFATSSLDLAKQMRATTVLDVATSGTYDTRPLI